MLDPDKTTNEICSMILNGGLNGIDECYIDVINAIIESACQDAEDFKCDEMEEAAEIFMIMIKHLRKAKKALL